MEVRALSPKLGFCPHYISAVLRVLQVVLVTTLYFPVEYATSVTAPQQTPLIPAPHVLPFFELGSHISLY
ncbi:hypothetical protein FKM82_018666 [Ascaphus truei]